MKNDIEWLKEQILILQEKYTTKRDISGPGNRRYYNGMLSSISLILDFINELDNPEVLSQEFINKNEIHTHDSNRSVIKAVPVDRLQTLLVPKQEITEEQVINWLDNNEFYDHITAETVLERAVDKGELNYYGTKYSVIQANGGEGMNNAEILKELKELGELLMSTSLNFVHPQFEDTYPEWSMVHSIGERLVTMSGDGVSE